MFGIGFTEFIVIGIIALLVVGPEKLPELAQKLGRFTWEMRRAWDDVRDTMRTEFSDVSEPLEQLRSAGRNARGKFDSEVKKFKDENDLKKFKDEADRSLKESAESLTAAARGKAKAKHAEESLAKDARSSGLQGSAQTDATAESAPAQSLSGAVGKPSGGPAPGVASASADEPANTPSGSVASEHPFRRAKQASKVTYFDLDGNPVIASQDK